MAGGEATIGRVNGRGPQVKVSSGDGICDQEVSEEAEWGGDGGSVQPGSRWRGVGWHWQPSLAVKGGRSVLEVGQAGGAGWVGLVVQVSRSATWEAMWVRIGHGQTALMEAVRSIRYNQNRL